MMKIYDNSNFYSEVQNEFDIPDGNYNLNNCDILFQLDF